MPKSRRVLIPIIIFIVLAIGGIALYFGQGAKGSGNGFIVASGTVEAAETSIAAELSGRVVEVLAENGQDIEVGTVLLRLDDTLLQAQRAQAESGLKAAQSNLETARTGLDLAKAALKFSEAGLASALANQKAELTVAQQELDNLYENAEVVSANADQVAAAAFRSVREATYQLDNFTVPITQVKLTALEGLEKTKKQLDIARKAFEPFKNESSGNTTREDLKEALDEAQADYDAAVKRMEYETLLAQAQAWLENALKEAQKVQDGPDQDKVAALQARIEAIQVAPEQARSAMIQAQAGIDQAEAKLAQAQVGVTQAQTQLDLVIVQMDKLSVLAPSDGVVLSRDVEPGEVIQAGAPLMTMGDLGSLKIRVYVPEDRYGQIKLGDKVTIEVDSFPGKSFHGAVSYIADQAEFIPRNVQTSESRRSTVFAVEVVVENPQGELKPGMPADVCLSCR
jgi:HlyD family secretion protein